MDYIQQRREDKIAFFFRGLNQRRNKGMNK